MKIYIPILLIIMVNACNSPQQKAENNTENNFERFRNVVFIIGDDHSTKVLGAYGNKIVKTPNLDEMAKNGVLFSHAYVNSPVCSPSRQSMITGKYPHASGVSLLSTPFPEEQISIADYLTPLGYKTAIIGKIILIVHLIMGLKIKYKRRTIWILSRLILPESLQMK